MADSKWAGLNFDFELLTEPYSTVNTLLWERKLSNSYLLLHFCNIIHITSSSTPNFEKCKSYLILLLTLPSWTQYDTIYLSGPRYQDITTKVFCCIRPNTYSNQERILMRHLHEEKRQKMQSLAEHSVLAAVSTLLASCLGVSGHKSASLNQGSQSGYSKYVLLSLPMQCQDQICTHKRDNQSWPFRSTGIICHYVTFPPLAREAMLGRKDIWGSWLGH